MSFIKDTFSPKSFLPVHISFDGMELLEIKLGETKRNDVIFVEIGDDKASTPVRTLNILEELFPDLLDQAIEENCEYISFYI